MSDQFTIVIEVPRLEILDVGRPPAEVLDVSQQGITGIQGVPGVSGGAAAIYLAEGALGGHRVVRASFNGRARYADSTLLADAVNVLGITQSAAAPGAATYIIFSGEIIEPSWAWVTDLPIFLSTNGGLTQVAPTTGFQLIVGVATAPTSMQVGIRSPIIL